MMEEIRSLLEQMLTEDLIQINMSNTRDESRASKAKVRPVLIGDRLMFQETLYRGTQVFHSNYTAGEMVERLLEYLEQLFKQAQLQSAYLEATILVSKKGKMTVKKKVLKSQNAIREGGVEGTAPGKGTGAAALSDRQSLLAHMLP